MALTSPTTISTYTHRLNPTKLTLATCSLNQWALDFEGNYARISTSILRAKAQGAKYRLGPELEVPGYGCNDHFYETDTYDLSWLMIVKILKNREFDGIILDLGVPIMHKTTKYNCRLLAFNGRILFIRPKMFLANDGNYRESRWFTPWMKPRAYEMHTLPHNVVRDLGGHPSEVPFGDVVLECQGFCFGSEICEELFTPLSPHLFMSLDGIEVFTNGSASHHELRKLERRIDLMCQATRKCGGIYLYSNHQGCDGERVYYDGCALIIANGEILAQGSQFSLNDVDVVVATIDVDSVRSYRTSFISRGMQAATAASYHRISIDGFEIQSELPLTRPIPPKLFTVAEEISLGPACWLWDYLRRSNMKGFFLALSGGIDSCSTAIIVYSMCRLVYDKLHEADKLTIDDVRRVVGDTSYTPSSAKDLCNRILHTCYMGSSNSSLETKSRAASLAESIGCYHIQVDIDSIVGAFLAVFAGFSGGKSPRYAVHGGSKTENLALQNVQARSRMVLAYLFAQLTLWYRGREGSLLTLGSSNVDECLRGYFAKYDCSSADLNPIGSISKNDLKHFISHMQQSFNLPVLELFLHAVPTAELEPVTVEHSQSDEVDMGMSYDELSVFGKLRKIYRCGPISMFTRLLGDWGQRLSPGEIATKVKRFFTYYAVNRHKMTTITPSYHCESYSPDDNRFDLRPFLYRISWDWHFEQIDQIQADAERNEFSKILALT